MINIVMIKILYSPMRTMVYLLIGVALHVALGGDLSWRDYFGKSRRENKRRITLGKAGGYMGILYVFCVLCFEDKSVEVFLMAAIITIRSGIGGLLLVFPTELFYRGFLLRLLESKTSFAVANVVQATVMAGVFAVSAYHFMEEIQTGDSGVDLFFVLFGAFLYSCIVAVLNEYVGDSSIFIGVLISGCVVSMFIIHLLTRFQHGLGIGM